MAESKWTCDICDDLRGMNAIIFAIVASMRQEAGWPDRYLHHRRWHGWLEFKGPKTPTSMKQTLIIERLNARVPGSAFIVRQPDQVEDARGNVLGTFDGTAGDLLELLCLLTNRGDA